MNNFVEHNLYLLITPSLARRWQRRRTVHILRNNLLENPRWRFEKN